MTAHLSTLDGLEALFGSASMRAYLGEPVTLSQHMLQAAAQAEAEGASDALVAAALLHDIGHVLAHSGTPHEVAAAEWLADRFPAEIADVVLLHVDAKRYLCAREPGYFDSLSPASVQSLATQGGPMSRAEAAHFAQLPLARAAIKLRRWDEAAKDPDADTPPFEHFRPMLERLIR